MLVIISDLHFTDGTTSNWSKDGEKDLFNIKPTAYKLFFSKISNIIERRDNISNVTFIYNGDIFDPLRTHDWFNVNENDTPWSVPLNKNKVYSKCHEILKKIVAHTQNNEALSWLNGSHSDFDKVWKVDTKIDRIYIPGNHDRIMNLYKPCRELIYESLLGKPGSQRFKNSYMDQKHQTIIMHGHEADAFNCEFDKNGNPKYDDVPIGDPMTTILFANLGYRAKELPIPEEAKRRFKDIDNVRPALSGIRYVQDIIQDFNIDKKVKNMLQEVVDQFEELAFYKKWQEKHDKWNVGFDEADKLQSALQAIRLLGTSVPAGLLEKIAEFIKDESFQKRAERILKSTLGLNMRYCIFGHTHNPVHIPLYLDKDRKVEKHYLNSGTFRTTFKQTFDKQDFLRFQTMAFVIIYGPNEFDINEDIPTYEMWSGLRMHH